MQEKNLNDLQILTDKIVNQPHQFSYESGIRVTKIEPEYAEGILTVTQDSLNPRGNVHGGAIVTLADTVAGCCAYSKGGNCVTSNQSMEFLRAASGPVLLCKARARKIGRVLSVIAVEIYEGERQIATGTFSFCSIPGDITDMLKG